MAKEVFPSKTIKKITRIEEVHTPKSPMKKTSKKKKTEKSSRKNELESIHESMKNLEGQFDKLSKKIKPATMPRTYISKGASNEKLLVENFIALQKVMASLGERFDELSTKITKLLELFEMSAKSFGKPPEHGIDRKLDNILEQNKVLARGISLMHEKPEQTPQPSMMKPSVATAPQQLRASPGLKPLPKNNA